MFSGGIDSFHAENGYWEQWKHDGYLELWNGSSAKIGAFVRKIGDKFFVGLLEDPEDIIEIDEDVAKPIVAFILAQNIFTKRLDAQRKGEKRDNMNYWITRFLLKMNCHKAIAKMLGFNFATEYTMTDYSPINLFLRTSSSKLSLDELKSKSTEFISESGTQIAKFYDTSLGIGRWRYRKDVHTFIILGFTKKGKIICFEKRGWFKFPFNITKLESIWKEYSNCEFGAVSWKEVKKRLRLD